MASGDIYHLLSFKEHQCIELRKQRDELLAALKDAAKFLDRCARENRNITAAGLYEQAAAAIARAETT